MSIACQEIYCHLIASVTSCKDLGIIFDNNHVLTMPEQIVYWDWLGNLSNIWSQVCWWNCVCDYGTTYTVHRNIVPLGQYGDLIYFGTEKAGKFQWRATCLLPTIANKPYSERLSSLQLPSLAYWRLGGISFCCIRFYNGYFSSDFDNLFTYSNNTTREHSLKLFKSFAWLKK